MPVFEYSANSVGSTEQHHRGTVAARDKIEAYDKVRREGMKDIRLKKLGGFSAFLMQRTVDIR